MVARRFQIQELRLHLKQGDARHPRLADRAPGGAELYTPRKTTPGPFDKLFNLAGEPIEYTEFSTDALLRSDSAGNTRLMKPT